MSFFINSTWYLNFLYACTVRFDDIYYYFLCFFFYVIIFISVWNALYSKDLRIAILFFILFLIELGFLILLVSGFEFLVLIYFIVYVGAVAVFFLFAIKLVPDSRFLKMNRSLRFGHFLLKFQIFFIGCFTILLFLLFFLKSSFLLHNFYKLLAFSYLKYLFLTAPIFVDWLYLFDNLLIVDLMFLMPFSFSDFLLLPELEFLYSHYLVPQRNFSFFWFCPIELDFIKFLLQSLPFFELGFALDDFLEDFYNLSEFDNLFLSYITVFSIFPFLAFYNKFFFITFLLAILLLVVMVGSLNLVLFHRDFVLYQNDYDQIYRSYRSSIYLAS